MQEYQERSRDFYRDIEKFNKIYKLQSNGEPTLLGPERLENFHKILAEEVEEVFSIMERYRTALAEGGGQPTPEAKLAVLTDLSDWLGDLVVYCASEAQRWGLPLKGILEVIMDSNFSKLGADGEPIYDERGKVLKGPHYWKPEPKISELLGASKS